VIDNIQADDEDGAEYAW